jgi:hypothetical protein
VQGSIFWKTLLYETGHQFARATGRDFLGETTMSNKARLSETRFNPNAGVDLDAIAERVAERDEFGDATELDFDSSDAGAGTGTRRRGRPSRVVAQFR